MASATPTSSIRPESIRKRSNLAPSAVSTPTAGRIPPFSPTIPSPGPSSASLYVSPAGAGGGLYQSDEDTLIFEFGARHVQAGFGGDATARATAMFGPESHRRAGDLRAWMPGFCRPVVEGDVLVRDGRTRFGGMLLSGDETGGTAERDADANPAEDEHVEWGAAYELWRDDLRQVDLGLVEAKLERALRMLNQTYLMVDLNPKRLVATFPALLPRRLTELAIAALFDRFHQANSIAIMPQPFLAALSAGVRTAVVVDFGWATTRVTVQDEFRTVAERYTIRAGRLVVGRVADVLSGLAALHLGVSRETVHVSLEDAEAVLMRVGWCRRTMVGKTETESDDDDQFEDADGGEDDDIFEIELPSVSPNPIPILFSQLAKPIEDVLFPVLPPNAHRTVDDHEMPVAATVFETLRSVNVHTRALAIERIVVMGGLGNVAGVKGRLKAELEALVSGGWNTMGTVPTSTRRPVMEVLQTGQSDEPDRDGNSPSVRVLCSPGSWAGASMVAALHLKPAHEVDRAQFEEAGLVAALAIHAAESTATHIAGSRAVSTSMVPAIGGIGPTNPGLMVPGMGGPSTGGRKGGVSVSRAVSGSMPRLDQTVISAAMNM